ncbi:cell surface protein SprA [Dysgonomonas sp. 216]|uniref:T9SS outer membrane translocon Sov/SprA n=1 Tax=Dysgonomonas sp. 216 TaxID=2302934 RepID=UPI0013CF6799|nr:cell surface protein SprA [Dysgonomonas sp. 216]
MLGVLSLFSGTSGRTESVLLQPEVQQTPPQNQNDEDSVAGARYPVKKTQISTYEDLENRTPIDLRDPSNVKTEIEYDLKNNVYLFKSKIDNDVWVTPFTLNEKQYQDYTLKQSMSEYFKLKNSELVEKGSTTEDYNLKDIKINIGPAEKIFGPGGIRFKPQGYVELSMGVRHQSIDDPTMPQKGRSNTTFKFDEKIKLSVNASVGDKVNFDLNYDTEATFDFDSKKVKLAYEGKEDEIIRYLEGGNISFNTTNSLIPGVSSLFGIRADLQFGKLRVNTVISQQESESQTVNSKGGVQTTSYEFKADQYDENRHFFLGHYFRDQYDEAMSRLPYVKSPVIISRMQVWVTNKRGNFDQARNIVAFADLGEPKVIKDSTIWTGTGIYPENRANTLYEEMTTTYADIRDISKVTSTLSTVGGTGLTAGTAYEKLESARLLSSSEYSFNPQLGYISLNSTLQSDEILAVAFEYEVLGKTYKVGEFGADIVDKYDSGNPKSGALILKLLKPVSMSPNSYTWHLMMKNVYSLGAYQLQSDKFRLNISYQSDTTGTYINYIPEGILKDTVLLRVMNLDRLDSQKRERANGDGIFDFLEGYTVIPQNGRIIFPVIEPFGSHLRKRIKNDDIADRYVYQQLYDSTLTVARQNAERNKFKISGTYKASNNNEIFLNATNVARGSVKVMAGGVQLTEGTHYSVDYMSGIVRIIDQSIIDAGTSVSVSLENQSFFSMQKKTMLGLNLSYEFSKDFNIGTTFMHMYEKPLVMKTEVGGESVKNTLWGVNTSYRTQSQLLTDLIDKLPFVTATAPSQIAFNGEFAHMIPGHYTNKYAGGYSYLDDFESSRSRLSLSDPYSWNLASTPSMFDESKSDSVDYGYNRAHMAWFNIDRLFTRRNSSLTPSHIKEDKNQLSNHFVREISVTELYPNRETLYSENAIITAFNVSYYPEQRGPYNLDAVNISNEGKLKDPQKRWGGIFRKMPVQDFESNNYEYIEFWLMDPFTYNDTITNESDKNHGGYLYFNLGDVSEDILKDGRKFYENGLPVSGDLSQVDFTAWGKVPNRQSTVYAFDASQSNALYMQDVGLNGLRTEEEHEYYSYKNYVEKFIDKVQGNADAYIRLQNDPFSPLNDPAGDNYHHYRGADYDRDRVSILDRYKYYNGTEGNSTSTDNDMINTSRRVPDVEDIDQDYTLNEKESYYQYKIHLKQSSMAVGKNYITEARKVKVKLENGTDGEVTWYLFKVPLRDDAKEKVGSIQDFKSIRFMRMFMHGFEKPTFLRFGTLELVRGEWRTYTQNLNHDINTPNGGEINVSSVSIEENSNKEPVNYVLPPGVTRILDPSQPQLRQENEQALSLQVIDLDGFGATRAVYKTSSYDLRRFKRLQMFTHAEELISGLGELKKGDLRVFIRLGSDYKNNYYEYEMPLSITPRGKYNEKNEADRLIVWPQENMFDFPLELLKNVKVNRNRKKRQAGSSYSYTTPYDEEKDPEKPTNKVTVMGNPSLAEINVIMIGVRNTSSRTHSAEIWVNELRVTDFDEEGGWAAQGNLSIGLSDIGTVNVTGRKETAGFGSIEQSLMERRQDDYHTYSIATNVDLGRFLPEKAKMTIPLYYTYTNETTTPQYDPLDQDVSLDEAMSAVSTKAEKDSIKNLAQTKTISKNFSLSGVKVNIKSKTPMPYDPANFTFGYAQSSVEMSDPTTVYDRTEDYKASVTYSYSPLMKTWKPFGETKSKAPMLKYAKSLGFNYLPTNISFNSYLSRYYTETAVRDLESYVLGGDNKDNEYLSFSSNFYWDRSFSMTWDFTKNLKTSIQTGTKAEIYEPYLQVNKKLNPDDYQLWKDTVIQSLKQLGTPLSYNQTAKVTYALPFSDIPFLDWANSSANYESSYSWQRGTDVSNEYKVGNSLSNSLTFGLNNRFNMVTLYNKSAFLRKVNQKFNMSSSPRTPQRPVRAEAKKPRKFEREVTLNTDSATVINHNLKTKNVIVSARRVSDGKIYKIKFKKTDDNTIRINVKDTVKLKVNVLQGPDPEEQLWYKVAQYSARGLMSLRSISINYSRRKENHIYGFKPNVGDFFGQNSRDDGMAPGVGFAFGFDGGEKYVDKLLSKEESWLLLDNAMNISPAIFNSMEKLDIKADLEPIKGLKINLSALRETNDRTSYKYMYDGKPKSYGGSFTITTISIGSAFESVNANNDYYSKAFEKFVGYRTQIANRLENKYQNSRYPESGFLKNHNASKPGGPNGGVYDPVLYGGVDKNSADVLIPAFLAAYTGKDPDKISLSPFPSLSSLVPNWTITYDGLITLPWIRDKFKSLRIMHGYTSQYRIGSYESFSSWVSAGNGLGFTQNLAGNPMPSSPYNISSVSIVEQFNPLFGTEGTLNNSLTLRARYNTQRNLNLNITSYQIVESRTKEIVVGMGYTINEFNRVVGLTSRNQGGFNNDLKLSGDLSYRKTHSLLRKIEEYFSQATAGTEVLTIKLAANYALSRALTLSAFFDRAVNTPLVSASSYPTTNTNFGVSIRFNLTQ